MTPATADSHRLLGFTIYCVILFSIRIYSVSGQDGNLYNPVENKLPENYFEGELATSKLNVQDILKLLKERVNEKNAQKQRRPRKMNTPGIDEKFMQETCGTSSSLVCGSDVLKILNSDHKDESIQTKCNIRKDFLDCIDAERQSCMNLAENGILPRLPPKPQIREVQEKVWRTLWTSGGCLLL